MNYYTFVLPAHNEERCIGRCIESIVKQHLPKGIGIDIIVVSNGSTDKTDVMVKKSFEKFKSRNDRFIFRMISIKNSQKGHALNIGRKNSKSNILLYGDADCVYETDSFYLIIKELLDNPKLAAVGALDVPHPKFMRNKNMLTDFQKIMFAERIIRGRILTVGRLTGLKQDRIPFFPEGVHSEDTWLSLTSAKKYGYSSIKVLLEAIVYYKPPQIWNEFLDQETRYEMSMPQLFYEFPDLEEIFNRRRKPLTRVEKNRRTKEAYKAADILKIERTRVDQLHEVFDTIVGENANSQLKAFIQRKGNWTSNLTTKSWE